MLLLHAQISLVFGQIDSSPFFYSFSERNTKAAVCIENSDSTIFRWRSSTLVRTTLDRGADSSDSWEEKLKFADVTNLNSTNYF